MVVMLVSSIMSRDPVTVRPDGSLDDAVRHMDEQAVRHLPVVESGRLVGLLSDRDLLEATGWLPRRVRAAMGESPECASRTVRDVMHPDPLTVAPDDTVVTVAVEAVVRGAGCLPVVSEGALVGVISELDLLRAYAEFHSGDGPDPEDPPVERVMTRDPVSITSRATLGRAREICRSLHVRHLPVLDQGHLIGIVSDRDLRRAVGRGRADDYPVDELMTPRPASIAPGRPVSEAARWIVEHRASALPVIEDSELVGIVTSLDLLDHCMNHLRTQRRGTT